MDTIYGLCVVYLYPGIILSCKVSSLHLFSNRTQQYSLAHGAICFVSVWLLYILYTFVGYNIILIFSLLFLPLIIGLVSGLVFCTVRGNNLLLITLCTLFAVISFGKYGGSNVQEWWWLTAGGRSIPDSLRISAGYGVLICSVTIGVAVIIDELLSRSYVGDILSLVGEDEDLLLTIGIRPATWLIVLWILTTIMYTVASIVTAMRATTISVKQVSLTTAILAVAMSMGLSSYDTYLVAVVALALGTFIAVLGTLIPGNNSAHISRLVMSIVVIAIAAYI